MLESVDALDQGSGQEDNETSQTHLLMMKLEDQRVLMLQQSHQIDHLMGYIVDIREHLKLEGGLKKREKRL